MIGEILPSDVVSDYAFGDNGVAPLFPEERRIISRAVDTRLHEFATKGTCTRPWLLRRIAGSGGMLSVAAPVAAVESGAGGAVRTVGLPRCLSQS